VSQCDNSLSFIFHWNKNELFVVLSCYYSFGWKIDSGRMTWPLRSCETGKFFVNSYQNDYAIITIMTITITELTIITK
jgi:hypothetical protein